MVFDGQTLTSREECSYTSVPSGWVEARRTRNPRSPASATRLRSIATPSRSSDGIDGACSRARASSAASMRTDTCSLPIRHARSRGDRTMRRRDSDVSRRPLASTRSCATCGTSTPPCYSTTASTSRPCPAASRTLAHPPHKIASKRDSQLRTGERRSTWLASCGVARALGSETLRAQRARRAGGLSDRPRDARLGAVHSR